MAKTFPILRFHLFYKSLLNVKIISTWSSLSSSASLFLFLLLSIGGVEDRLLGWFSSLTVWCPDHRPGSCSCSTLMGLTWPCRGSGATPRPWYCWSPSKSLRYLRRDAIIINIQWYINANVPQYDGLTYLSGEKIWYSDCSWCCCDDECCCCCCWWKF